MVGFAARLVLPSCDRPVVGTVANGELSSLCVIEGLPHTLLLLANGTVLQTLALTVVPQLNAAPTNVRLSAPATRTALPVAWDPPALPHLPGYTPDVYTITIGYLRLGDAPYVPLYDNRSDTLPIRATVNVSGALTSTVISGCIFPNGQCIEQVFLKKKQRRTKKKKNKERKKKEKKRQK